MRNIGDAFLSQVAVLMGQTAQHACAGLLSASTYRVVGDPYGSVAGGQRRHMLHFELRPRPSATLDLSPQLVQVHSQTT